MQIFILFLILDILSEIIKKINIHVERHTLTLFLSLALGLFFLIFTSRKIAGKHRTLRIIAWLVFIPLSIFLMYFSVKSSWIKHNELVHFSALFAAFVALRLAQKTDWKVEDIKEDILSILGIYPLKGFKDITNACRKILEPKNSEIREIKLMTYISAVGLMGTIDIKKKKKRSIPNEISHKKVDDEYNNFFKAFKKAIKKLASKSGKHLPRVRIISCKPKDIIRTYLEAYFTKRKKDERICLRCIHKKRKKKDGEYESCIKCKENLSTQLMEFYKIFSDFNIPFREVKKDVMDPGTIQFLLVKYKNEIINKPCVVIWTKPPLGYTWNEEQGFKSREIFCELAENLFNYYWKNSEGNGTPDTLTKYLDHKKEKNAPPYTFAGLIRNLTNWKCMSEKISTEYERTQR